MLTSTFQNCSNVNFDQSSSAVGTNQAAGDGTDLAVGQPTDPNSPPPSPTPNPNPGTGPVVNPPGGTTPPGGTVPPGTPTAPAGVIPKVIFVGPPCIRGSNCLVAFELDQPYAMNVDFDWLTNDTIYTTPSTPIYGQPNVHYIPNSGHITFAPGTIRKEVFVQNINQQNIPILIGIRMRTCAYGGVSQNCTQFFRP